MSSAWNIEADDVLQQDGLRVNIDRNTPMIFSPDLLNGKGLNSLRRTG
jgi:hypothetical protein